MTLLASASLAAELGREARSLDMVILSAIVFVIVIVVVIAVYCWGGRQDPWTW